MGTPTAGTSRPDGGLVQRGYNVRGCRKLLSSPAWVRLGEVGTNYWAAQFAQARSPGWGQGRPVRTGRLVVDHAEVVHQRRGCRWNLELTFATFARSAPTQKSFSHAGRCNPHWSVTKTCGDLTPRGRPRERTQVGDVRGWAARAPPAVSTFCRVVVVVDWYRGLLQQWGRGSASGSTMTRERNGLRIGPGPAPPRSRLVFSASLSRRGHRPAGRDCPRRDNGLEA